MNAFAALLKREWLEHRTPYLIGTFGVALLICVAAAFGSLLVTGGDDNVFIVIERIETDGHNTTREEVVTDDLSRFGQFSGWTDRELSARLTALRQGTAMLFHVSFFFVVAFILLGCVFDERRDRSILFWKSMPTSSSMTILSKLLVPVWLAPLLVVAALGICWLLLLSLLSAVAITDELGSASRLWAESGIVVGICREFIGYLLQGFWALPVYAWLILVSSAVSRLPLLWAAGVPIGLIVGERVTFGSQQIFEFIARHLEFTALPRLATAGSGRRTAAAETLGDQLALTLSPDFWLGIAIGAALLAAAVWCHRRNNEL